MTEISAILLEDAGLTSVVTAETRQILEEGRLPQTQPNSSHNCSCPFDPRRPEMPDVVSLLGQITQPQEQSMQLRIGGISFFLQSYKKTGSETIRNHIEWITAYIYRTVCQFCCPLT